MKYRHYAPKGELTIYEGNPEIVASSIAAQTKKETAAGKTVGIITTEETKSLYSSLLPDSGLLTLKVIGSQKDPSSIARSLYGLLRDFDASGTQVILSECFFQAYLGQAIMNRLLKAAGYRIIHLEDS